MGTISFYAFFLLFSLIFHSCLHYEVASDNTLIGPNRETLEIIIGGGGVLGGNSPAPSPEYPEYPDCPPPPPPPVPLCPSPPSPPPPSPPPPSPPPPSPPPPPPPPSPPPPPRPSPPPIGPFESERLRRAYFVIQEFKKKIKKDPMRITDTWVGSDICNKYKGYVCDKLPDQDKTKALAGVDFNGYGFAGPKNGILDLNGFINNLTDLAIFHANSVNFTGSVPTGTKESFRFFYELDLSNNKLSGYFPRNVLEAKNLTFLDLRFNQLSGLVPPEVFNLDLDVLFINDNKFRQKLPDNFGSTTALYLTFANNRFTGPIPRSIGRARNLLEVLFLNNQFTGCLPYEIGFLSNATVFDVGSNKLTGQIPFSFGCLAKMELLNLGRNQFYGPVPEIVCKLPNLVNLTLSHNYFTQVGPECRKLMKKKVLDVRMNCILDLPNQKSKDECATFFSKPKYCDNQNSMKIVPCKKNWYLNLNSSERSYQQPNVAAPPPRSYNALIPHRL